MNNLIRRRVSQNRQRFVSGRYDLDLSYITDNIIAMGYPADKKIQIIIRNHINHVAKFLNERHRNSFKIFNLCSESDYNFAYFQNMVEVIPFDDHTPPKFLQISELCAKADSWLKESLKNVIIVHCKAGKGRTGTMISCYLMHSKKCQTPFEAMRFFEKQRTKDLRGVTIPSQRRYVEYYGNYLKLNQCYEELDISLQSLVISQDSNFDYKYLSLQIHRKDQVKKLYDSQLVKVENNSFKFDLSSTNAMAGDIQILFMNKTKDILFSFTFNTFCSFYTLENDEYSLNESSYQGKKALKNSGEVVWTLTKPLIDGDKNSRSLDLNAKIEVTLKMKPPSFDEESISDEIKRNLSIEDSPAKNNRISTYDNLDIADYHKPSKAAKKSSTESKKSDSSSLRKDNFFSRLAQTHLTNNKKRRKSLYKANSEPFINSQCFDPTMRTQQEEAGSIESLDLELELAKTSKDK